MVTNSEVFLRENKDAKGALARQFFEQGYNCAQSVAGAFAVEMGMPQATVFRLVSGFGGGMGRLREVCGAVTGMFFVLSALYGYEDPKTDEEKKALYARVQTLAQAFAEKNGSIVCRDLLGLKEKKQGPTPEKRTAAYYAKRPCGQLVEQAADLLQDYLANNGK
jgi:C_GCAxxG_C_C family probable redox protein